jgi:hypothetical protein
MSGIAITNALRSSPPLPSPSQKPFSCFHDSKKSAVEFLARKFAPTITLLRFISHFADKRRDKCLTKTVVPHKQVFSDRIRLLGSKRNCHCLVRMNVVAREDRFIHYETKINICSIEPTILWYTVDHPRSSVPTKVKIAISAPSLRQWHAQTNFEVIESRHLPGWHV